MKGEIKMKKSTKRILVFVLTICIVGFGAYGFGWVQGEAFDPSTTYEVPAKVAEVDRTTGWVTLVDWADEAWCIRGEGYEVGQLVNVVFNDNDTPNDIYDDMVEEVHYLVDITEINE